MTRYKNTVQRDFESKQQKKTTKRRIQHKINRKAEQMTCKEWSKKYGKDCYGDDDAQDGPDLELRGQKTNKRLQVVWIYK